MESMKCQMELWLSSRFLIFGGFVNVWLQPRLKSASCVRGRRGHIYRALSCILVPGACEHRTTTRGGALVTEGHRPPRAATAMSSALNGIDADTDAAAAALLFLVPGRKAEAAEMLPPISWNGHPPRANNTEPYRQPWAPEEDLILRRSVALNGARQWTLAAQALPGRSAKQCRERWVGALDPSIRQTPFTEEEDELVIAAYRILGSRWAEMAKILTGRTDNAVKNRANSGLRAQLWPNVRYRPRRPRRLTPRDNPPPVLAPFPSAPFESPVARVLERVPKSAILSASPRAPS